MIDLSCIHEDLKYSEDGEITCKKCGENLDPDAIVGLLEDPDVVFTVFMGCETLDEAELRAIALDEEKEAP